MMHGKPRQTVKTDMGRSIHIEISTQRAGEHPPRKNGLREATLCAMIRWPEETACESQRKARMEPHLRMGTHTVCLIRVLGRRAHRGE